MADTTTSTDEQAPVYTDMFGENSPPAPFKVYMGARLSLDQVNAIMADAYEHKITSGDSVIPDFGGARKRFADNHHIEQGFWVTGNATADETVKSE